MIAWPHWEAIPFHVVWISLTIVYGFRAWSMRATAFILGAVVVTTGGSILADAFEGIQLWGELFEVPLISAMFLAMVWRAQRRVAAIGHAEALAESRALLLARQESFLHDVSHELRTPVTIATGHLELLRLQGEDSGELTVALEELGRIDRIIDRLLLLAKSDRPDFLVTCELDAEAFLEDVFVRWSEVASRGWRLGATPHGALWADEERLRVAIDALLENAVKYTEPGGDDRAAGRNAWGASSWSRSPTTAAGSPRRPSTASSSASRGSTTRGRGRPAVPASASRSSPRSRRRTGAPAPSPPSRAGRSSRSGCRRSTRRRGRRRAVPPLAEGATPLPAIT